MICQKCGNEILSGSVCDNCGTVNAEAVNAETVNGEAAVQSEMRVTAYGAVVPNDGSVYIASSLQGVAAYGEDAGETLENADTEEREMLGDVEDNLFAVQDQQNTTSAYATAAPKVEVTESDTQEPSNESKAEPVIHEEEDVQAILQRAKTATSYKISTEHEGHPMNDVDLQLEEPLAYDSSVKRRKRKKEKKKSSSIMRKISGVVIAAIVILLATPTAIKLVQRINYDKQIQDIVTLFREKDTNMNNWVNSVFPYFVADAYWDMDKVCDGNIEYRQQAAQGNSLFNSTMKECYEACYTALESAYGDIEDIKCTVKHREEMTKEEREAVEKAYASMSVLTSGVQSLYLAMEEMSVLSGGELEQLADIISDVGETMSNLDISSGYTLEMELKVVGSKKNGKDKLKVVVIRADKKWMIDYLSTFLINTDKYDNYTIATIDQFVDYEMNVNRLNEELKRMGEYIAEHGTNGLTEYILQGVY